MKRTTKINVTLVLALLTTALLATSASAQTTTVNVSYTWTAPTSGSAVDHYVVEVKVDSGNFTQVGTTATNSYTLTAAVGHAHQLRVAGVDAQDRQGPFSVPSDTYTPDAGAPSAPGKPVRF
ncbi:MAG: hypothetical protein IPK64_00080 [bacterium]|nr:hypothetical protein [bacterium]